jgi:hypothetical protein
MLPDAADDITAFVGFPLAHRKIWPANPLSVNRLSSWQRMRFRLQSGVLRDFTGLAGYVAVSYLGPLYSALL